MTVDIDRFLTFFASSPRATRAVRRGRGHSLAQRPHDRRHERLPRMARTRVLLVEDDILIAWTISSVLKQLGCTVVDYADNADQAVERAIAVRPDVILMDIGLAGSRDGIAAAEEAGATPARSE